MNPTNVTDLVAQTKHVEPPTFEPLDPVPMPAQGKVRGARLRHGALLGIALLSAWLGITTINSIIEINAELDRIYAVIGLPLR